MTFEWPSWVNPLPFPFPSTKINVIITNRHCLLVCGCSPAAECRDPACGSSLRVNNHGHGYTHKQTHNQTHVKLLLWPQVNLYNHYGRWMVKCIHWISITLSHEHFDNHIRKPAKILSTEYYSKWFNLRWVLLSPLYIYHCCKSAKLHFLSVFCCSLQMPHTIYESMRPFYSETFLFWERQKQSR